MCAAAKLICTMGCKAVLVKGGHFAGDPIDILFDGEQHISFTAKRIQTKNTHGTGCTLSSAIASNLALGYAPAEAVKRAKDYMTCAIEHALELGHGAPLLQLVSKRTSKVNSLLHRESTLQSFWPCRVLFMFEKSRRISGALFKGIKAHL